jgi:hypothetical protein
VEEMSEKHLEKELKEQKTPALTTMWIGLVVGIIGLLGTMVTGITGMYETKEWLFMLFIGVLVAGFLILFFALILRRIKRKGIDYFVLGAITAYLGFLLLALPTLIYIFTFGNEDFAVKDYVFFIIMGFGVLLIIFGFFIEAYDLNEKILELFRRIGESLRRMLQRIKWKLILSPWNILTLVGIGVIVLTAVEIFIWIEPLYFYLIGAGLIVINLIIHLRKELVEILKDLGKVLATFFQSLWRGIKYIPNLIVRLAKYLYDPERFKRMIRWVKAKFIAVFKWIGEAFKFIFIRNYLLLFAFGIALFFLLNILEMEIRIALTALVCGVAIIKPILDWREHFGEDVSKARMFLYKTGQKTRNLLKRRGLTRCAYCLRPNPIVNQECWNCKKDIPRCLICNNIVEREIEISRCKSCDNIFHVNHLQTWIRFNPKCPVCKEEIKKIEIEEFEPELIESVVTEIEEPVVEETISETEDTTSERLEENEQIEIEFEEDNDEPEKLETDSEFRICNHCKKEISSTAKFCTFCGKITN